MPEVSPILPQHIPSAEEFWTTAFHERKQILDLPVNFTNTQRDIVFERWEQEFNDIVQIIVLAKGRRNAHTVGRASPFDELTPRSHFWTSTYERRSEMLNLLFDFSVDERIRILSIDEDEIHAISLVLAFAKSQRNSLTSSAKFPPEVLIAIFEQAFDCDSPVKQSGKQTYDVFRFRCIEEITHVCHDWRAVSLRHSKLWSVLDWSNVPRKWRAVLLARSPHIPLSLILREGRRSHRVRLDTPSTRELRAVLGPESLSRLEHLVLEGVTMRTGLSKDRLEFLLHPHADSAIPPLRSLSILNPSVSRDTELHLHQNFLVSNPPHLDILHLRLWSINWTSPLLSDLVELKIELDPQIRDKLMASGPWQNVPTTTKLAAALRGMPRLKSLTLHYSLPEAWISDRMAVHPYHGIQLPSLRVVDLKGNVLDCADVMDNLTVPTAARRRVEIPVNPETTLRPSSFLSAPAMSPYALRFTSWRHYRAERRVCSVWVWMRRQGNFETGSADASLHLMNAGRHDGLDRPSWLAAASWNGLNLEGLQELYVDLGRHVEHSQKLWRVEHWMAIFGRARAVNTIYVHEERAAFDLFDALRLTCGSESPLFPALDTLVVGGLPDVLAYADNFFRTLCTYLEAREERGEPLFRVEIPFYYGKRQRLERMKAAVGTLTVLSRRGRYD